jgi:hypothetical protein
MRQALPAEATVAELVNLIDAHALDSCGLGRVGFILAQLLEPGDDELNLILTSLLRHCADQLALIEHANLALICPSCGRKEAC